MREIECSISGEKTCHLRWKHDSVLPFKLEWWTSRKTKCSFFLIWHKYEWCLSERETHLFLVCAVVTDFHEHCQKVR